ncbi:MAG: glycoside hydrolase family 19 protein [Bacteroidia bacterium]
MNLDKIRIKTGIAILTTLFVIDSFAQNTNLEVLLSTAQWDSLFPKRAGTFGVHPQGYTADFYSFEHLSETALEMSDYSVEIRRKNGVWGELITVTQVSNGNSFIYSDVEAWWFDDPSPESIVIIDFEDFLNTNSEQNNLRELAAFLANISKETTGGWEFPIGGGSPGDYAQWGLYFVHEVGYNSETSAGAYSQPNADYPPNPSVGYYGRGPIQLSWNYNYGQLSKFLYNDENILLDNPDLLQQDAVLAFKSAIWFWMMPQCPKPSCHQVMHDLWEPEIGEYSSVKMYAKGFAHTNNIINGGLECRSSSTPEFTEKVVLRSELYKHYLGILGFTNSQISFEDSNNYSTLCYESSVNTMENYINCNLGIVLGTQNMENTSIIFYPNPTADHLNIQSSREIDRIEIVNIVGQTVMISAGHSNQIQLNVSSLSSGYYFIKLHSGDTIQSRKFLLN